MNLNAKSVIKDQKGQALVFVIATLTVAMAVAVGVSLRNLSSISRTTRSDTASRVRAAAEGGAENVLAKTDSELDQIIANGGKVEVVFSGDDNVTVVADVTVEEYYGEGGIYNTLINGGESIQVSIFTSSQLKVCWNSVDSAHINDLYLFLSGPGGTGTTSRILARADDDGTRSYPSPVYEAFSADGSVFAIAEPPYENCYSINATSSQDTLRIRALTGDVDVFVVPINPTDLPAQGYKITSIGRLQDFATGEESETVATVLRSKSYLPSIFDFGLYSAAYNDVLKHKGPAGESTPTPTPPPTPPPPLTSPLSINISNPGGELTNYDVLIDLDTASMISGGNLTADCGDLRFFDSDDSTSLQYWIEGGCNTSTTQIWVRVPLIPSGNKTIYMHFDGVTATDGELAWSGNFTLLYDSSCPAGWTRNSTFDGYFVRGNSVYGGTGGTQGHNHNPVLANISSAGGSQIVDQGSQVNATKNNHSHTATVTPNVNSDTRPPYLGMVYCSNPDLRFQTGMISLFTSTPAGFTRFTPLDNRFPLGASTYGATGGSATHIHTYGSTSTSNNSSGCVLGSAVDVGAAHSHNIPASSLDPATSLPPYRTMVYAEANNSSPPPPGTIIMTNVAPPLGYSRYTALDARFPYGSVSSGANSGSGSHSHTDNFVISNNSKADCNEQPDKNVSGQGHTHGVTLTSDTQNHTPPYINVLFYQRKIPAVTTTIL